MSHSNSKLIHCGSRSTDYVDLNFREADSDRSCTAGVSNLTKQHNSQVSVLSLKGCQLLSDQLQVLRTAPVAQLQLRCACSITLS